MRGPYNEYAWPPLGNEILSFIEGWPYLRGGFVLNKCIWDSAKWPV